MEMKRSGNIIEISGNVKSIEDSEALKAELDMITKSYNSVSLIFKDAMAIPSAVIGYLTKLANNGIKVSISVKDETLYSLFKDLNLLDIFHVRKI